MQMPRLLIVLCCLALVDCDEKAPPAPPQIVEPAGGSGTLNGTERIGWDQPATDASELAKLRYVMYVDGTRTPLDNVSCVSSPTTRSPVIAFACATGLPALTPGAHTLELATVVDNGARESVRSALLQVTVVRAATQAPRD